MTRALSLAAIWLARINSHSANILESEAHAVVHSPEIYNHVNPYGIIELDMGQRTPLGRA